MNNINYIILLEEPVRYGLIFILIVVLSIGFFLLVREILCWYWKINLSISIQQDILKNLEKQSVIMSKILEYQSRQEQRNLTNKEPPNDNSNTNNEIDFDLALK